MKIAAQVIAAAHATTGSSLRWAWNDSDHHLVKKTKKWVA